MTTADRDATTTASVAGAATAAHRWMPAALAFTAEIGHLAAAVVEAPAWPLISGFHILVAAALGLIGVGLLRQRPRRRVLRYGRLLAIAVPVLWLTSRSVGLPLLLTFTRLEVDPLGITVSLTELTLAVTLLVIDVQGPCI